ncbi:hypothetical protein NPIL_295521 [Nephila pilipes]|uniref:Uncharacterized protein n=1 Tax=Nephila pilipes TaxID=299642 RepID=A0A8X6UX55_NEPPI|nr:hypothetical protein NPIL_295521 [Nephila pilipes]
MAVVVALNRKRGSLKGQVTKLISAITDEETMDMPQPEAQLEILKKIQEKSEVLKEDYYKSTSDEEYLTTEASLSEIDQEIQHLEKFKKLSFGFEKLSKDLNANEINKIWEYLRETVAKRMEILNSSIKESLDKRKEPTVKKVSFTSFRC